MSKESDSTKSAGKPDKIRSDAVNNDLDARPEDIDKVKGGGRKRMEDPCAGGESPRP